MLDLKLIRQTPEILDNSLRRRGKEGLAKEILDLDSECRHLLTELQTLQTTRNTIAKQFGDAKREGKDTTALAAEADAVKKKIADLDAKVDVVQTRLHQELSLVPNLLASDVPDGADESNNVEISRHGTPRSFSFSPKSHFELGESLGMMDFERAAKLSGSRFVVLSDNLARLERALATFMLDVHTQDFGYTEVYPPLLVNDETLYGTGQLPKMKDDQFQTTTGYWLIPTAEVVLTNLVAGDILNASDLPLRYTAYTPCFRSEAGAAGRDTRGMIRQHQFGKVELVSIIHPQESQQEHERMRQAAEVILQRLNLPYRLVTLCSGDIGFAAQKTYDLEVWLPSQNTYREISSCSNCGDFQARRMNARFRPQPTSENQKPSPEFVHTLNGSGVAVGRALVAIMENYQEKDGSIRVPEILLPYMRGVELIQKK